MYLEQLHKLSFPLPKGHDVPCQVQDHRTIGSVVEDGGHLCHVTWTIYIKFLSPFPRK